MCFSASASFTAGVLLTVIGTETLRKVHKPSQVVFACVPLFFAFQQFTEGVLWLAIGRTGFAGVQAVLIYVFSIMAQVIWPLLIPLSVLLLEQNKTRKSIIWILFGSGAVAALYYIYSLVLFGMRAEVLSLHISYSNNSGNVFGAAAMLFYLAAALGPMMVSSVKRMHVLGLTMILSCIVAVVFYEQCLTSVWCFFAAVISFGMYYIIRDAHKKFHIDRAMLKKAIRNKLLKPVLKLKNVSGLKPVFSRKKGF